MYDLCIIGGGAAGLSCAITAGRLGLRVLLIEKNQKLGKKLYATGNGKCNLTNMLFDIKNHYNSSNKSYIEFINKVTTNAYNSKSPNHQLIDFMSSICVTTINDNDYIYPASAQASSVVWAMIDELNSYNIEILLNTEILSIEGKYPSFTIKSKNEAYKASQVVLSCGGASYKSLGGTYAGYNLAEKQGHNIISARPSLCGLCIEEDISDISGVRANAIIKLINSNNQIIQTSKGELQLTKQGISGICIFEISSKTGYEMAKGHKLKVNISLLDAIGTDTYNNFIKQINDDSYGDRTVIGLLNGVVNDKLAAYVCKLNHIDGKIKAKKIEKEKLKKIIETLNNLSFNISNLYDMEQAQVTAGGVNISEINPKTLESYKTEGLYIIGELLDIDGICGGYNLTFAMLSGIKAGKSIYDKNKSN